MTASVYALYFKSIDDGQAITDIVSMPLPVRGYREFMYYSNISGIYPFSPALQLIPWT